MSADSPVSSTWRDRSGQGFLNQAYDPAQSFAYTSVCSGIRTRNKSEATSPGSQDGILDKQCVQDGLSDLGLTGDAVRTSYLTLSLSGCALTDVSLLSSYPHIQRLALDSNSLTDLSVLSNIPCLTYLDASYNKLSLLLDFQPPTNLIEVNYSHNEIEEICDLSAHHSLSKLVIDSNQITAIQGISSLSQLSHLSLADNRLESITDLCNLPLKYLNLAGNSIKVIQGLETLSRLQSLDLSGNSISSFKGLENNTCLIDINFEENEVVDIKEVTYLSGLRLLKTINLSRNPMEALAEYRAAVLFYLPTLKVLDHRQADVKEKVAAQNRFAPTSEVIAALDHRTNIIGSVKKPARICFSTLTRVDEPYPMLVLCGPPGSGNGHLTKLLVEDFPNFFGLGVSHTTRHQKDKESHGRDYYFIDESTFSRAAKSGEFIQTFREGRKIYYGLTMAAIEQVAQQGLACVTHMSIEGVLTLKKTHFEPRYILMLPLNPQIHAQRLKAKGIYSDNQIEKILREVETYVQLHQDRPGFFDTAINTDNLHDGYSFLRAVVMAYGDISPESPLSLSSASQQTSQQMTSVSTSERTTPQPNTVLDLFEKARGNDYNIIDKNVLHNSRTVSKSWSRPHSSLSQSETTDSRPLSGSDVQRRRSSQTPPSSQGGRRHMIIRAAVSGRENGSVDDSVTSSSRPVTGMSRNGDVISSRSGPTEETLKEEELDTSDDSSSEEDENSLVGSSLSKLSSERGFSPENPDSSELDH